jgi:hypothetical protein
MQLDRARRDPGLAVVEVKERDPRSGWDAVRLSPTNQRFQVRGRSPSPRFWTERG